MIYVLWPQTTGATGDLGGKARALAELHQAGLPIPPWFALTPAAFYDSLTVSQRMQVEAGDVRAAATLLRGEIRLDAEPLSALAAALAELSPAGEPVAVRSSAGDEDGVQHSFAGQLDSFLFVPPTAAAVAERVAAVWRSAFSQRMLAYREQHGLPGMPQPPAVLVQRMVSADRSGVAFGADPVSGRRGVAVVAAVWGLGTALVSGESDADTYHVDRAGNICLREIAIKRIAHCAAPDSPEGVEAVPVPEAEAARPVLTDEQVRAVADLVRKAGRHSGHPRDIEWAIEAGSLYLLQSRPITALAGLSDPDGALNLWDNSNIAESYNGITTPLTFSFARRAYTEVYRQMCRTLGVSSQVIAANDDIFRHMLGLIRGRVYYNLLNWYRLLVLLPGFASNRGFMEQMMGVREGLPDEMAAQLEGASGSEKLWDGLRMAGACAGLLASYVRLPWLIRRFHADLDAALAPPDPPLEEMRADELAALYRRMEQRLLTHWDPPLVNDLFAMIFYGLLGKLTTRWCDDPDGTLRNTLVRGRGGMISAEPAERVREMAELIAGDPEMAQTLRTGTPFDVARAMETRPAFAARYRAYLYQFGDRCIEELKLESPTLQDDPTTLHRAIGCLAGEPYPQITQIPQTKKKEPYPQMSQISADDANTDTGRHSSSAAPGWNQAQQYDIRQTESLHPAPLSVKSVQSVDESSSHPPLSAPSADKALAGSVDRVPPLQRPLFYWVLGNARNRVRDRENLRFERTRLFGRVRRIFVEIGKRFAADGLLDDPRDVFYLEVGEVLGFVTGTTTCTDLRALAALRRAEFDRYRNMPPPDDRFETRGMVYVGNGFKGKPVEAGADGGDPNVLKGLGCCPGVVRARVRVVLDPRGAEISPGSILVAERTDPGWVMLFPAAAGLLVERGSLLSHSAIVAREMGIPAIVSIPGLTRTLIDGEMVEMDGSTGIVRRIAEPPAPKPDEQAPPSAVSLPAGSREVPEADPLVAEPPKASAPTAKGHEQPRSVPASGTLFADAAVDCAGDPAAVSAASVATASDVAQAPANSGAAGEESNEDAVDRAAPAVDPPGAAGPFANGEQSRREQSRRERPRASEPPPDSAKRERYHAGTVGEDA
jgi:rifampicin phosphotransferase